VTRCRPAERGQAGRITTDAFCGYAGPVGDSGHRGTLARTHEGKPGLPRGRSRLPRRAVRESQRERLVRSVIAAVAESGYQAVTVADIVRRAKVSRAAFYAHFTGKEGCFLTAAREGGDLMLSRVTQATHALPPDTPDEQVLRVACRAYLEFLADEPAFAKVFYVDVYAVGLAAIDNLKAAARQFADMDAKWHERARVRHPEWPAVPPEAHIALVGATGELVRTLVRADKTGALPDLEDTLVAFHLAVMAGRPWPAST
jgi:AcrR family transcriptional regulator